MQVHLDPSVQQNAEYAALVTQKKALVEQAIDVATAEATWELRLDSRGRPLLVLRLWDHFNGQCSGEFAPDELRNELHFSSRLHSMKGALIRVGHWRGQLQLLFGQLRAWSQALPGTPFVQDEPLVLREERSGEYEAVRLVVTRNGRTMRAEPIAAWVVGADGRVDLNGLGGPFTLIYIQQSGWFYYKNTIPTGSVSLTEPLFRELAEACLDG